VHPLKIGLLHKMHKGVGGPTHIYEFLFVIAHLKLQHFCHNVLNNRSFGADSTVQNRPCGPDSAINVCGWQNKCPFCHPMWFTVEAEISSTITPPKCTPYP